MVGSIDIVVTFTPGLVDSTMRQQLQLNNLHFKISAQKIIIVGIVFVLIVMQVVATTISRFPLPYSKVGISLRNESMDHRS